MVGFPKIFKFIRNLRADGRLFLISYFAFCPLFILIDILIDINKSDCRIYPRLRFNILQHFNRPSNDQPDFVVLDSLGRAYNRDSPLIFIGGMARSGTTLMRVLLDAHPEIRCGEETGVILSFLGIQQESSIDSEKDLLQKVHVTQSMLNDAISSSILNIIVKHGKPAPRLCNKEPFIMHSAIYLHELFPNAKMIFKISVSGFNSSDFRESIVRWNDEIEFMNAQCQELGESVCLPVHYEQLVLKPEKTLRKILNFLQEPWSDHVLHHEQLINQTDEITLSKLELSTDQVIKPINIEALGKWKDEIPKDIEKDLDEIAPMLRKLGYDANAGPEQYGSPDELTRKNEEELKKNADHYSRREEAIIREREQLMMDIWTTR